MSARPDLAHIDVRYVADLARIALTDVEAARFQGELNDILAYVAQLGELDLEGVAPTAHAAVRGNVMREDRPHPGLERGAMLANAPAVVVDAFVRVPPVLEEGAP